MPGRSEQESGTAICRLTGKRLNDIAGCTDEGGFQDQVFRRIAGDEEFRIDDEIGAGRGRSRTSLARLFRISGKITQDRIELRECDPHRVRDLSHHDAGLPPLQ